MITAANGHVLPAWQELADDAKKNTKWPFGYQEDELTIPDGEREWIHNVWAEPTGRADHHVWLATPGHYEDDGSGRGHVFEITTIVRGKVKVTETGKDPVELEEGDIYIMQPNWSGAWDVSEYVVKPFTWVYVD